MVFDQVEACAEVVPCTSKHDRFHTGTRRDREEIDQLIDRADVECVALLRAVQRHDGHTVIAVLDVEKIEAAGVEINWHEGER